LRSAEIRRLARLISCPVVLIQVLLNQVLAMRTTSASAAVIARQRVLMATIVRGIAYVALPIPGLVGMEMVEPLLPALRERTMVAVARIKAVVDVAIEASVSVKPRAGSDEYAANKPVGPIVAVGRAFIWRVIEVPVGAYWRHTNVDPDSNLG
jgi:hypothetical protein